jgi:DNA-binding CsgD family transcriptional regulator
MRELSRSIDPAPGEGGGGAVAGAATTGLAEAALRAGLTLLVVVAATDCVFALVAGAGALAAAQGVVLVAVGLAAVVRVDLAARVLRPRGRIVLLAGVFGAAGTLDAGLYEHFGGVAGAMVFIAAVVGAARWVVLCGAVCVAGYVGGLALHGSSLPWMLGDGRYEIANHLVNFAGNGAVGLLMVALLRRFLADVPERLAAVRSGGRSLTPQLALAAGGGRHLALLSPADARTLIAPLTQGERQVMALLAAGRAPKQAAHDLSIALATVRSRIASAKRKTGARTLDQLVAMYSEAERAA